MAVKIAYLGYAILPITFFLLFTRPSWMLPWTVLLSPFQAFSVINVYFGDFPIAVQPGYFVGTAFIISTMIKFLLNRRISFSRYFLSVCFPLLLFVGYAIISAFVLPTLFKNAVVVHTPRGDYSLLQPGKMNYIYVVYMLFSFIFFFFASLTIIEDDWVRRTVIRAYIFSGFLISSIGIYQVISWHLNLPYFDISNWHPLIGEDKLYLATWYGVKRLTSTFTEASTAGHYLSGVFAFSLGYCIFVHYTRRMLALLIISFISMILTFSTTAYITILAILLLVTLSNFFAKSFRKILPYAGALFVLCVLISFGSQILKFDLLDLISSPLLNKTQGGSFAGRTTADLISLKLIISTRGLGVGWGSNRASSLLLTVISNAGWGAILLLWFAKKMFMVYRKALHNPLVSLEQKGFLRSLGFHILAMLIAGIVAVPDLQIVALWVGLSIFAGVAIKLFEI